MSVLSANLFTWLQGADFYRDMHVEAAGMIGTGLEQTWLDVGCGPGLMTRIAAARGFAARGIDLDLAMIDRARKLAVEHRSAAKYEAASFDELVERGERFDVVSASSLLVVSADPARALLQLTRLLNTGGRLLTIEATATMSLGGALAKIRSGDLGSRGSMLALWSAMRSGRTLPVETFTQPDLHVTHYPLVDGFVRASVVQRAREAASRVGDSGGHPVIRWERQSM